MSEGRRYRPRRSYWAMALLGLAVALLFGWELGREFAWPTLFFLLISLFVALSNLRWAASQVDATGDGIICHRPPVAPLHIGYRQIVSCEESGRGRKAISLIYYPTRHLGFLNIIPRAGYRGTYYSKTFEDVTVTNVVSSTDTNVAEGVTNLVVAVTNVSETIRNDLGEDIRHRYELGVEMSFKAFKEFKAPRDQNREGGIRHVA